MVIETIFVIAFVWKYGFFALFAEIVISLVVGFILISKFGVLDFLKEARNITPQTVFGNFGTVFGGFLILLPGIFSDTVGIIIIIVSLLMRFLGSDYANLQKKDEFKEPFAHTKKKEEEIIDVEVIE
ncbi:FxsA family membrane protein [Campylobacter corcagiensis]|nr:FxsA family membrane protein [Campylobacter corcagiensis]